MAYIRPIKTYDTDLRVSDILNHFHEKHPGVKLSDYPCSQCEKSYPRLNALITHIKKKHLEISSLTTSTVTSSISKASLDTKSSSDRFQNQKVGNSKRTISQRNDLTSGKSAKKICHQGSCDYNLPQTRENTHTTSRVQHAVRCRKVGGKIEKLICNLVLTLYGNENLSRSLALEIITSINTLTTSIVSETLSCINPSDVAFRTVNDTLTVIEETFFKYSTDYRILSELNNDEYYIPSNRVTIGSNLHPRKSGNDVITKYQPVEVESVNMAVIFTKIFNFAQCF